MSPVGVALPRVRALTDKCSGRVTRDECPLTFQWEFAPRSSKLGGMEEVLPPSTMSGAGFEPTRVRQFTIFLENRVGRLGMLIRTLEEEAESKVVALSIEESADSALVRLICSNPDGSRDDLHQSGFSFSESEVLAVELPPNSRQPLLTICSALLSAEINIHYAYPLLLRLKGPAIALYVEDPTLAAQILIRKGFTLIGESDLKRLH